MDSEITIYKHCYKIKLIDLSSFNYLKNIDEYSIKKDLYYPKLYTEVFIKKELKDFIKNNKTRKIIKDLNDENYDEFI
jgi:uncharacterized membrane protein YheB (UPF0754 family)